MTRARKRRSATDPEAAIVADLRAVGDALALLDPEAAAEWREEARAVLGLDERMERAR